MQAPCFRREPRVSARHVPCLRAGAGSPPLTEIQRNLIPLRWCDGAATCICSRLPRAGEEDIGFFASDCLRKGRFTCVKLP
jgi:hypothetical protein